ncbi:MAG TPA: hypothetical protein VIF35_11905 [Streptosporangiaceae bacterium]
MAANPPPPRLPASAPTASDLAERDRYATVTAGSLDAVRASAAAWRNGLAAFLTLVTTGVIIKGRDTAGGLAPGWRAVITILIGGGLALAIVGLWQALGAEAGTNVKPEDLDDIRRENKTLDVYLLGLARGAARKLQWGRYTVAAALICLLAGIIVTWWAPAQPAAPPAYLRVARGSVITCGTPRGTSHGVVRLSPPGGQPPVTIPLAQITGITVTASCP